MYTLAADFTLVVVGVSVVVVVTCTHGVILWRACAQEERATLKKEVRRLRLLLDRRNEELFRRLWFVTRLTFLDFLLV